MRPAAPETMREATIRIPHDEFENVGLEGLVSLFREAGLRDLTELVCRSDGCLVAVTVDRPIDEGELTALDCLEWWERLEVDGSEAVYLCEISFPDGGEDARPMHSQRVSNDEIRVDDGGIDVALVGSQEDISREIGEYGDAGMTVLLRRMTDYGGPRGVLDSATDRQRETLQTAYELGYYDVPRSASTADVANELDLDASTVAEHLQRAESNIVANLLDGP